ncbi:MAG: glycosyltransferase family 39 protein [Planctomycetia bacterium]
MSQDCTLSNNTLTLDSSPDTTRLTHIFWGWTACHVLIWTLVPYLTQPNLPLDAIEMLYIGHEWPIGHFKHPTLPGWLAEAACLLTGNAAWAIYLLSQLAVGTCFWAAWRLGREILSPRLALVAAALLEGCWYYNFKSTEFNNNLGMYPFWALAILFLYWAMHREKNFYWIMIGVSLGLGMLAKYATGILAVTMLLYMIVDPSARRWWRRLGPYLTLLSAAIVFAPNLYWALTSRFGPVKFAIERTTVEDSNFFTRLWYPIEFTGSQLLALLPLLIVALPMLIGSRRRKADGVESDPATRRFLSAMVLWPLALHLIISALGNLHLRSMYGSQLWTFFGVWLLYTFQVRESRAVYRRVACGIILISIIFVAAIAIRDTAGPVVRKKASRIHFPGKALATKVHELWAEVSDAPLPVVAGQWWPAANVGFYGPTRTTVYGGSGEHNLDFAHAYSAWTSDEKLSKSGGIVIWLVEKDNPEKQATLEKKIAQIKIRFPMIQIKPPFEIKPETLSDDVPPIPFQIGIIPPSESP